MLLSVKQIVFLSVFVVLLLLQIILGESYLKLVLYGIWMIFFAFYFGKLNFETVRLYKTPIKLWFLWLGLLLGSYIFTHNVPLSLIAVLDQFFGFCVFIFFLTLKDRFIPTKFILVAILLVLAIATVVSMAILIFPGWGSLLPGMNLLYPSYGHNHLAAALLMVLPLSWWFSFEFKRTYFILLPTILTIGLLVSFGRVAVLIGVIQLLVLGYYVLSKEVQFPIVMRRALIIISVLLVIKLLYQSFFSLSSIMGIDVSCSFPRLERQLCKSMSEEPRLYYWKQAVQAIEQYPLTGYGPGTFALINAKYQQVPQLKTLYAHNEYLQNIAEVGIIGGFSFILLIFVSIYKLYLRVLKNYLNAEKESYFSFLFLGLLSICLNNFFDYDWHFSAVLLMTALFFGLSFKQKSVFSQTVFTTAFTKWTKIFTLTAGVVVVSFAVLNFSTNMLIQQKKETIAFKIFPYFFTQYNAFLYSSTLTDNQMQTFRNIYKNHSSQYSNRKLSHEEIEHLILIDPWVFAEIFDTEMITSQQADQYIEKLEDLFAVAEREVNNEDYRLSWKVSQKFHRAAETAFQRDETVLAYKFYEIGARFDHWSIHTHPVPVDRYNPTVVDCEFAKSMLPYPEEAFGDQREYFAWRYIRCVETMHTEFSKSDLESFLEKANKLAPWIEYEPKY